MSSGGTLKYAVLVLGLIASVLRATTTSFAQWVKTDGPNAGPVTSFAVNGQTVFVGTSVGGVYRLSIAGTTCTPVNNGLTNTTVLSLAVSDAVLFAATFGGGVFVSANAGTSWTVSNDGLTDLFVQSLAVDGSYLFAGTEGGVFLSSNGGVTWTSVSHGLTSPNVRVLAIAGEKLFAGTNGSGVCLSTDRGATWNDASTGLTNPSIFSLTHIGRDLFAGTYGGLFHSTNDGQYWESFNLVDTNAVSYEFDNTYSREKLTGVDCASRTYGLLRPKTVYSLTSNNVDLFVGTYGSGAFRSSDYGTTWSPFNTGLTNLYLYVVSVVGPNLFAGSFDGEVWRFPLAMITGAPRQSAATPKATALQQNYPNPFNPRTTIRYSLPRNVAVKLTVFNIQGMEVATLIDENEGAGDHEVRLDGSQLPSGIYFYCLRAGDFVDTKKFVLLK